MKNKAKADGKRFVYLATAISALGGMLFGYDIGVIDHAFVGSQAWRWMFALAVIPASAFGIGLVFIPNSPRWLAARGHADMAMSFVVFDLEAVFLYAYAVSFRGAGWLGYGEGPYSVPLLSFPLYRQRIKAADLM
jgi:MFS family permease